MSLQQQILTADSRASGWETTQTLYLHVINFNNRTEAEEAFEEIRPHYHSIWETGTWDGQIAKHGHVLDHAGTSSDSHIWVDENNMGFSLCISFSNQKQRNAMKKALSIFYKDNDVILHVCTLNQSEKERIDRLREATHSVELDVSNAFCTDQILTDFANAALTADGKNKALYIDTIAKDGKKRLKAYFDSESAAQAFSEVCDHKIRRPLVSLSATEDRGAVPMVAEPKTREFPTAKYKAALVAA